MVNEKWKDIVGYEGLYQVSDMGRIKSYLRRGSHIPVSQINFVRKLLDDNVKQCEIEKITGLSEATIYRIKHNKVDYSAKILKPTLSKNGYFVVQLKQGCSVLSHIHRLVLESFVSLCPKGMECRHLDGNPGNNNLPNLKWGTRSENQQDSIRHGTKYCHFQSGKQMNNGVNNPMAKLSEDQVRQIKKLKGILSQAKRAKMFGVSPSAIQNIDDNRTWENING